MAWGLYLIHAAGLQDAGPGVAINLCITGFGASALLKGLLSFLLWAELAKAAPPLGFCPPMQGEGVGVIGVIECNFLKPAHNKQDFEESKEYQ